MFFKNAEFLGSVGFPEKLCEFLGSLEVVFAGRSNVGKSSIINRLFNRKKLARKSSTPGKTATVNFYCCDGVFFVDLPGYGYARASFKERSRFEKLIGCYFAASSGRRIAVVVLTVDFRRGFGFLDFQFIEFLNEIKIPFIVVLTKSDKLKRTEKDIIIEKIMCCMKDVGYFETVQYSSKTGEGNVELRGLITKFCKIEKI